MPTDVCAVHVQTYADARDGLSEVEAGKLFIGVVSGLRFLHARGVYHFGKLAARQPAILFSMYMGAIGLVGV